jgi:dienelactone hydrolase
MRKRWRLFGTAAVALIGMAVAAGFGAKDYLRGVVITFTPAVPPSGIYAVGMASADLPPPAQGDRTPAVSVRLWYPADISIDAPRHRRGALSLVRAHENAPLAATPQQFPVILYAPSWNSRRDDNTIRAANLASHGYVVVAFDDVVHDPEGLTGPEGEDRTSGVDFASADVYTRTRPLADARAAREARKASLILDRLAADAQWGKRLALSHVGFLGFSFGGAAAAESTWLDPRIAATVNIDGWVFGKALSEGVKGPYLVFWSDMPVPYNDPSVSESEARLTRENMALEFRQQQLPDKFGFMIKGLGHLDFTDRLTYAHERFQFDRVQMRNVIDAYLLDFFGTYLQGHQPALLKSPPLIPQLREIKSMPPAPAGSASAPIKPE